MSNNRMSSPPLSAVDPERIAHIQSVLGRTEEPTDDPQPDPKLNGNSRITNPVPITAPEPPLTDRVGTSFGVGQDFEKNRSFEEYEQLLAREMARQFGSLSEFEFDENPARHAEQVLHLHRNMERDFATHVDDFFTWFAELAYIGFRAQLDIADASRFDRIAKATRDAGEWARSTSPSFPLPQDAESYKPKTSPFSRTDFALVSPQEQLEHVRQYWCEAFLMHSRAILTAVAQSVEVSPLESKDSSLFGVIKYDELHRQATYNYFTREVDQKEQVEQAESSKRRLFSTLQRTTTTKTVTKARQLIHHQHSLINVERLAYQPALNAPWLQMPPAVADAMRSAPTFLHAFLDVFAGDLRCQFVVARDLETTQSVSTEHRDIVLPHDPALTLFRNFVLTGWNPADMKNELQRRSQVRVRQLRQTHLTSERGLAEQQRAEQIKKLRLEHRLVAVGLGVLTLGAAQAAYESPIPTELMFAPIAAIGLMYLVGTVVRQLDQAKEHRNAVRPLDTEHGLLEAELDTLKSIPLSEL